MPGVVDTFELAVQGFLDFTMVCHCNQHLTMQIWRALLWLSVTLHDLREMQVIAAMAFGRCGVSRHYGYRVSYCFQYAKLTAVVGCSTGVLIDVQYWMEQCRDIQTGWRVLTRHLGCLTTITADKGCDWGGRCQALRDHNFQIAIVHNGLW